MALLLMGRPAHSATNPMSISEIELQGELNFPLIVLPVACRINSSKLGRIVVIQRSRGGWHSIDGESRIREVRVISQVEELGTKFHPKTVG